MSRATIAVVWLMVAATSVGLRAAEPSPFPLRNARAVVEITYETISTQPMFDRKVAYRSLSPSMQEDLWTMHLENYLATHVVTAEQRAALVEGLGLLTAGVIERGDSAGADNAYLALQELQMKAQRAFGTDEAAKIFSELGRPPVRTTRLPAVRSEASRPETNLWADCDCSTSSNWCDTVTNPTPNCKGGRCRGQSSGCGTFWQYPCDGLCSTGF